MYRDWQNITWIECVWTLLKKPLVLEALIVSFFKITRSYGPELDYFFFISEIKRSMEKLERNSKNMYSVQFYLKGRSRHDMFVVEHNLKRVNFWSFVYLFALLATAAIQITFIKSFFAETTSSGGRRVGLWILERQKIIFYSLHMRFGDQLSCIWGVCLSYPMCKYLMYCTFTEL